MMTSIAGVAAHQHKQRRLEQRGTHCVMNLARIQMFVIHYKWGFKTCEAVITIVVSDGHPADPFKFPYLDPNRSGV